VWLTSHDVNDPHLAYTRVLKETDWLLNEAGDRERTAAARRMIGTQTRLITCLAAWNKQDPTAIISAAQKDGIGLYGFTKPTDGSLKPAISHYLRRPISEFAGDERNIATLSRTYLDLPLDYVQPEN